MYKAVLCRDRAVTETTSFLHALFRSHLVGCVVSVTFSRVVSVTDKTVTSLHALKLADSVPLDTAVDSVPIPIARQKTDQKGGPKAVLTDDVKLKLAQHISSELDARHVLLISGKRDKNHVVDEMLELTNEYLVPSQITKATLNKWIFECIAECVEWEAEFSIEEKNGGSKKSGQDNMPDDSHKVARVQLMREAKARSDEDRPGSAQKKQRVQFNGLTGKIITPSLFAPRPSIAGTSAPTAEEVADVDAVIS